MANNSKTVPTAPVTVSSECHFHVYCNVSGNRRAEKRPIRPVSMIKHLPVINPEKYSLSFHHEGFYKKHLRHT